MQEHIVCFIGGMIAATVVFVCCWAPWRYPNKDLVLRCRERVQAFRELSESEQKDFLDSVKGNPDLHTRWRATCVLNNAFGGVEIAIP